MIKTLLWEASTKCVSFTIEKSLYPFSWFQRWSSNYLSPSYLSPIYSFINMKSWLHNNFNNKTSPRKNISKCKPLMKKIKHLTSLKLKYKMKKDPKSRWWSGKRAVRLKISPISHQLLTKHINNKIKVMKRESSEVECNLNRE
jgi:hypothetical protein